jgi:signal transduction histidine kinase
MFRAVLGHDLRTPLSVILTSAELLQRLSDDDAVRKTAARMLNSGKRMARMIDNVLDLARARLAGGIPLRRERIDLGPLVHQLVQEHRAAHPHRRIEVLLEGDLFGEWDADRMSQVVSNLVGNSLQHGDDSEAVQVGVNGTNPDVVSLWVANAGHISPDELPHLFDPFRGGRRRSSRTEGLGLGLYIVQQVVHAHHGTVDVQSEEQKRIRFRVRVPRRTLEVVTL